MNISFHTLYWDNAGALIDSHKKVMDYFKIPINYDNIDKCPHGLWMDEVMKQVNSDIKVFFDSDCVPINTDIINNAIEYVRKNDSFIGIAQASNHIPPKSHIYAAPAFYVISQNCYNRIGTSFIETQRSDVGEEISYNAERIGQRYRVLYPTHFEREPIEGVWRLGNYGVYGVGTVFANSLYHLYQGRMGSNLELFAQRCNDIIDGTFSTSGMFSATTFDYDGRIVP